MSIKEYLDGKKAFIFDLDGTLIDSMGIWHNFLSEYLSKINIVPPVDMLMRVKHMSLSQSSVYVKEYFSLDKSPEMIKKDWTDIIYDQYKNHICLKSGARRFLEYLKQNGKEIAIATANVDSVTMACLKNNKIDNLIDCYVFADEVKEGKDSPKIYLKALEKMNSDVIDAVLFEDIITAVYSANKINLDCIGIYDNYAKDEMPEMKRNCRYYLEDFNTIFE